MFSISHWLTSHACSEENNNLRVHHVDVEIDLIKWCFCLAILGSPSRLITWHATVVYFTIFLKKYYTYNSDTHDTHTLTPINANPTLRASSKTKPANSRGWRSHHKRLAVDGNVAYHLMRNVVKSQNIRSHGESNPGPQVLLRLL